MANTSGQGSQAVVPKEVKGWNWGAFLLTWIWGLGNHVWLVPIVLVLVAGVVAAIDVWIEISKYGTSFHIGLALFPLALTLFCFVPFIGFFAAIMVVLNACVVGINDVHVVPVALATFAGFITAIVLGMKGSEWASKNKRWDGIGHFKSNQRRWARWGTGISVVLLVFLIVSAIPEIEHQLYHVHLQKTFELDNVQTAVTAMMADNNLKILPNPVGTATNDMGAFPDVTSVAGSSDKPRDLNGNIYSSGDKNGYLLYGHDMTGDNDNTTLVNYVLSRYTKGTYTVNATGEVTQVTSRY